MLRVHLDRSWIIFVSIGLFSGNISQSNQKSYFWIINKKICIHQQKMTWNDAIVFNNLKELRNSFQASGNRFWDNKQFSRYRQNCNCRNFKKNNEVITKKCWSKQNNEVLLKIVSPILIIWVNIIIINFCYIKK